ncbi:unnamed protein product [Discula destructiva]
MPPASRRSRHVIDDEEEEQRPRQRQRHNEPDEDEDEDEVERAESEEAAPESADSQLIKKLVRYAMACEFSRTPIRRDGIKEKVLGDQGRAFRRVFDGAQRTLRLVFGMEMVELPIRDRLTKEEKRKAVKSQNKSAASGTYVLVSTLPEALKSARIIAPSRLVSADDEAAYVGFYTLVIALIRINGDDLPEAVLRRHLRRLNAEVNTFNDTKTEEMLSRLQKHGYLVKSVDKEARQHGDAETGTRWLVGPRGKVEVTNEAIAGLVRAVWDTKDQDEGVELEKKLKATLNIREREPVQVGEEANGEAIADESRMEEAAEVEENGGPSRRRSRRRQAQDDGEDE